MQSLTGAAPPGRPGAGHCSLQGANRLDAFLQQTPVCMPIKPQQCCTSQQQGPRGRCWRRTRAPPPAAVAAPLGASQQQQVLDMEYMRKVYKETQLEALETNASPLQKAIDARVLKQLRACTTIQQLQQVMQRELPSMSAHSMAAALDLAAFRLNPRKPQPAFTSASSSRQPQQEQQGSQPQAPARAHAGVDQQVPSGTHQPLQGPGHDAASGQHAHAVVEALIVQLAAGPQQGQLQVHVSHVATAVLCAGRCWGSSTQDWRAADGPSLALEGVAASVQPTMTLVPADGLARPGSSCPGSVTAALRGLLQHIQPHLFVCTPAELSRLAQGLGYLQLMHPQQAQEGADTWMTSFVKVVQSKMFLMDGLQLSMVAWCVAKSGHQPADYWLASMASVSEPLLANMGQVSLSNLMWAVCKWRYDPGPAWREAAWSALARCVPTMGPKCLTASLTAVRHLQQQPTPNLMRACMARLLDISHLMTPAQDCQVLYAVLGLDYLPSLEVFVQYIQAMQARLHRASPAELATIAWALSNIGFLPSGTWRAAWARSVRARMRGMQPHDMARCLGAFVRWRVRPPRALVWDVCELSLAQARAGRLSATTAARMLLDMAQMRLAPPRQLLRELLLVAASAAPQQEAGAGEQQPGPAAGSSSEAQPEVLASLLGDLVIRLPWLLGLYDRQQLQQNQQLVAVVVADDGASMAGASVAAPAAATVAPSSSSAQARGAGQTALEPGPLPWVMDPDGSEEHAVVQDTGARGEEASHAGPDNPSAVRRPREVASARVPRHRAADVVDLLLPPAVAIPLFHAVRVRLHLMSPKQLHLALHALASMRLHPGREFLLAHVRAVAPHLGDMAPWHKLRLDACYKLLTHDPSCIQLDEQRHLSSGSAVAIHAAPQPLQQPQPQRPRA